LAAAAAAGARPPWATTTLTRPAAWARPALTRPAVWARPAWGRTTLTRSAAWARPAWSRTTLTRPAPWIRPAWARAVGAVVVVVVVSAVAVVAAVADEKSVYPANAPKKVDLAAGSSLFRPDFCGQVVGQVLAPVAVVAVARVSPFSRLPWPVAVGAASTSCVLDVCKIDDFFA